MTHPRLHDTILALYQGCRDVPLADFKGWAMEVVRHAVAFDSGLWGTSDVVSDTVSSIFLFNQPKKMMDNYLRMVRISGDPFAQQALAEPGITVVSNHTVSNPDYVPAYVEHTHRYGMEAMQCTCHISPVTRVTTFISFYRSNPDAPFTESDRQTKEYLVPHLIEAFRINLFSWLSRSDVLEGNALAICDAEGRLYETTPRFPVVVSASWPQWFGPSLPLPFAAIDEGGARWIDRGLTFRASPCQDLFLISVAREDVLDRLSRRQLQVAEMLVKGKRYKDISRELGISPSTVTNHVNQIHARLEIDGREALIRLFDRGRQI